MVTLNKLRYCPKCRAALRLLRLGKVLVDFCFHCGGMWLDKGELESAAGGHVPLGEKERMRERVQRTSRACPACSMWLYSRELASNSGVMIDECAVCGGVWLDKGELSAAETYLKAKRSDLRRKGASRKEAQAGALDFMHEDSAAVVVFQFLTGLPVEINLPQRLFSPVVTILVGANVLVLVAAVLSRDFEGWIRALGAVPSQISSFEDLHTLFTSMFMHAGVLHLLGNMYFLWVTGDNLEEQFGPFRFLGFYLLCGLAAGVAQVLSDPSLAVPCVGASGAISGMLGAYVVLFPRTRFLVRWFYFLWLHAKFELPAYAYFLFWILFQILMAALGMPGVGWFAHIGGFLCGVGIGAVVRFSPRWAAGVADRA